VIESEAQRRITARWVERFRLELTRADLSAFERSALEGQLATLEGELAVWDAAHPDTRSKP